MDKEFVSYEQAIALKEIGFDEPCLGYYHNLNNNQLLISTRDLRIDNNNNFTYFLAPLKQQVFRWFRDKHKLYHTIDTYFNEDNTLQEHGWYVYRNSDDKIKYQLNILNSSEIHQIKLTYEEAEDACIDKLIKIVKQNNKK